MDMLKKLPAALALTLLFLCGQGQVKDTMAVYFDESLEPVKKKQAIFVGAAVRMADGWKVLVYTDSLQLLMRGSYTDHTCTVKNGPFIYYNGRGQKLLGGSYSMNKRTGLWQTWHLNGQLKDSIAFDNDLFQGQASSFYPTGQLESSGWYQRGQQDSIWKWFHENGKPATLEWYRSGKLADLECFDTLGITKGSSCAINREPAIKGHYGGLFRYLNDSLRVPERIREQDEGFVRVRFTVNKNGQASAPEILSAATKEFRAEISRVINSIPGWYPAISHNRAIDHIFNINIPYFLRERQVMPEFSPAIPFMQDY
jgi:hypothetical protein